MNTQKASLDKPVAIIGMAGKFGDSNNVDELWEHLKRGDYLIKDIPLERWDYRPYYGHDKSRGDEIFCKSGSFIEGVDLFDPFFFNISEREAESLDPQLRLFMQAVWEAAEDAGAIQSIKGSSAGLFVANCFSDYYDVARQQNHLDYKFVGLGNAKWFLANRLCYFLDIHGPSMTIDTACSSSLVALDLACQALKNGRCETAIVGGVNLSLHPSKYQIFCGLNALSKTGNSYPFDEKADGYVPGEGIAVLLLKPLVNAIKDNDQIYGVIKGSYVNSAGKSLGPIYPNQELETDVILHAWQNSGIDPEQITYFEAHGTGTRVGDPLEFNAIKSAFSKFTDKRQFCALGTIKGNIGHTEAASGIAGVIKVLLQMKYHTIPTLPNLDTINPMIDVDNSPLYFNRENIPWQKSDETARVGVVSSYGIATYAHIVIEDFLPKGLHRSSQTVSEQKPFIILLSAKDNARLKEQAIQLLAFIQENKFSDAGLPDMAYTLQVGREPMVERLAIVVDSIGELAEKLKNFIKDREDIAKVFRGHTRDSSRNSLAILAADDDIATAVAAWIQKGKIDELLTLWVDGLDFDWNHLYHDHKPQRISLPTYPFAKKRFWVPKNELPIETKNIPRHDMIPVIHPFVHENISDFNEQRFRSTFSCREFFYSDHDVKGERFFPSVVFLEMARAAVRQSSVSLNANSDEILLKNVACAQPIAIRDQELQIHISLFPEERDDIFFEVFSESGNVGSESMVHCQGRAKLNPVAENLVVDIKALQAQCTKRTLNASQFYEVLSSEGFSYGKCRKGIEKLYLGSGQVLAKLTLPSLISDTQNHFVLHPIIMDSALQASVGLMMIVDDKNLAVNKIYEPLNMPFALRELSIFGSCTLAMWAYIRFSHPDEADGTSSKIDIDIYNDAGMICFRIIGLLFPNTSDSIESKVTLSQPAHNKESKPVSNIPTTLTAEKLQQELSKNLSEALDIKESKINFDVKFHDMGFDSIVVLEWIKAINSQYGTSIAPTKIYEYPSIREFAVFLENELKDGVGQIPKHPEINDINKTGIQIPSNPDTLAPSRSLADSIRPPFATPKSKLSRNRQSRIQSPYRCQNGTEASRSNERIAIIGISGKYPDASNMDQYWNNLAQAKNSIQVIPKSRWNVDDYYDPRPFQKGKVNCKWMGLLDNIECFDPLFFNISPSEAELMDPQHRLILQEGYKAFEDCGYNTKMLSNKKCGVYLGMIHSEYGMLLHQNNVEGIKITGDSFAIAAGRISYHLNLTGPAITVDTACSSSLVATHLACQALLNHEIEIALVGGVCLFLTPECYISMCESGMLSSHGQCKSFDNNADGFVPGEGVGAIVLKRLSQAESDNDPIYGVIIGSGVNQDGKTSGITAPCVKSQTNLVREVYDRYDIDPQSISYVEMHGTGTKLGDPMELEALSTAFGERTKLKNYCAIASVKSNIGHTCSASGVASIQKVLLSLKHQRLVPSINFGKPNDSFNFEDSPFFVNTSLNPWVVSPGYPYRAAINSFGFSGTNAHIVIEGYSAKRADINRPIVVNADNPILFVLSAKNKEQLTIYANVIKEFISTEGNLNLSEMAYTLQVGRDAMGYRIAFQADSKKALLAKLEEFVSGASSKDIFGSWINTSKDTMSTISSQENFQSLLKNWFQKGKLNKIAELWVKGLDIDWTELYGEDTPHRISLPTYPFALERYWIPKNNENKINISKRVFHPLLHENISNFSTQRYQTIFSGSEFFFSDHKVQGHRVLPAVAYLEMAYTAMNQATEHLQDSQTKIRLKDIFWTKPMFSFGNPLTVEIVLHPEKNSEFFFEIYSQPKQDKSNPIYYSQGKAAIFSADNISDLDIQALRSHDALRSIPPSQCYEALRRMGIEYGPGHRAIDRIYAGSDYVLTKLTLPESVSDTQNQFGLHPSLMDSALQASICLGMEVEKTANCDRPTPALPFALEELEVFGKCRSTMWAFIRYSQGAEASHTVQKLDIDLCDDQGIICVRMKGFSSRALESNSTTANLAPASSSETFLDSPAETIRLVPVWEVFSLPAEQHFPSRTDKILIVGGTSEVRNCLHPQNCQSSVLNICHDDTIEAITKKLKSFESINHIFWIAPHRTLSSLFDDALIVDQNDGVLQIFRMTKALLALGYGANELSLTFITIQALPIHKKGSINPTHATIHGMVGSLAKEYPNWKIRAIDMETNSDWAKADIMSVPPDPLGNTYAYRSGEWYRQTLVPLQFYGAEGKPLYKSGGVYVVIGGAGGIGEVWSEYMIRNYHSRIIWIGRRQKDAAIQSKINRLGAIGTQPLYFSADATDREALQQAYKIIKKHYSKIDGLVHAAIVLLDKSLAKMTEDHFISGISAKVDVSVRMAQVFHKEPLDFFLFFSSIISFYKTPGQSNYASGSTFEDAFAYELGRILPCSAKIINWAYWGSVGVVATEAYQRRMAKAGMDSIEPPEAMETLEFLLAGPMNQIALTKVIKPLNPNEHKPDELIDIYPENLSSMIEKLQNQNYEIDKKISGTKAGIHRHIHEMDELLLQLLWSQLKSMGLFSNKEFLISEVSAESGILDIYNSWLEESFRVFSAHNYMRWDGSKYEVCNADSTRQDTLWNDWNIAKEKWISDSGFEPRVVLAETTLHALPDILTGKVLATDVLFPDTSMDLVKGIYNNDTVAGYFNDILAETLVSYFQERIHLDPATRISILEIGAGTGGTSAAIFKKLKPYRKHIHEYCYTDISKSFLSYAEANYAQETPYLTYNIFNVDLPVSDQGIHAGAYDLVIASNVLHATKNIRKTLRNAKAALKNNGLMLLNELSRSTLFTHLTFGLLKGWWLYQDPSIRIPGCPALYPETWKRLLEEEGFRSVYFQAKKSHRLGLQTIIAESDGIVRQKRIHHAIAEKNKQTGMPELSVDHLSEKSLKIPSKADISNDLLREKGTMYLKKILGKTLKLQSHKIDSSVPLENYGMDSIMVVHMVNHLSKDFHNVNTTLFFEYQTIEDLVEHFLMTQKDTFIALFESGNQKPYQNFSSYDKVMTIKSRPPAISAHKKPIHSIGKSVPNIDRAETPSNDKDEIAIIGLAGRYPLSKNIHELWKNLTEGRNCITEIPIERWNWKDYFSKEKGERNTIYSKWGGFIENIDKFDPQFFQISPREAKQMDPQERLFLEEAYACIEDAGYTPENLSENGTVGVFVGVMNGNYPTGSAYWSIANRVSFLFDFKGPSISVDTACSSSLTAIHLAMESINSGTSECAIAGGVNLIVDPIHYLKLSAATMLSSSDKCRSFGDQADGFVDGEGVGAIVLKPLNKAISSNDHIYGIIKASMLNAGGKTNGYTIPNPNAQFHLIFEALKRANVDARAISYLEAHGTGTSLGDPLEISGLNKAFQEFTNDKRFCSIGSIKSNIGHCESASGIAGLTKVLLQLKYGKLVPSLHSKKLNPNINFSDTPFVLQHELEEWKRPVQEINGSTIIHPRISGISSFGAGGANAHLIIEEYIPDRTKQTVRGIAPAGPVIIILSAKDKERLRERARQLLTVIQDDLFIENHLINDVAFTLQVGREAMDVRLALIVTDFEELEEKLIQFLNDQNIPDNLFFGRTKPNKDTLSFFGSDNDLQKAIDAWISKKKYAKLLRLWVRGLHVDWGKLYIETQFHRISLPTYPFAGEHYWADMGREKTHDQKSDTPLNSISFQQVAQQNSNDGNKPKQNFGNKPYLQTEASHETTKHTMVATPKPQGITLSALSENQTVICKPIASQGKHLKSLTTSLSTFPSVNDKVTLEQDFEETISLKNLEKSLSDSLADYLYIKPNDVEIDQKLVDMGLDSVIGVEWIHSINKEYGTSIVATKVYDYPTIREFAKYLSKKINLNHANVKLKTAKPLQNHKNVNLDEPVSLKPLSNPYHANENNIQKKTKPEEQIVSLTKSTQSSDRRQAIAIIGMSGRYPDANNLDQFWENLLYSRNSIREIPSSRWDPNPYFDPFPSSPGKIYCKSVGFLDNADCFDPLFFSISPAEAKVMDPQQRIFLEEGYKAFEDAGYNVLSLNNKKCAVYMGIMSNEYSLILHDNSLGFPNTTGNSFAIAAARISYFLNLKGPAIPIDTGCSSSLVGTHLACQALLNREIDMALVGAVSLYLIPESYIGMCADQMLSPEGQCKPFDNDADGFVPGEGVGALVLKRLQDAEADNDNIYGLIIASGINQDGKTNGITAPSISSQIELEREIYHKYQIDPLSISYVEMHGTGTKLGDPIEMEALSTVFHEKTDRRNYCAIGSVKSNIGHTSAAAGVAGIQKVLLCLKHRQLVPTLNYKKPNEHFNLEESPFYVNTESKSWRMPDKSLRRAAVSSFGFSGTNSHIVIEEYSPKKELNEQVINATLQRPLLFLLSAKNRKQLKIYAEKIKYFVETNDKLNLVDMSFTLQVGRSSMNHRLAFFAESKDTLLKRLNAFIADKPHTGILSGDAKKEKSNVEVYELDKDANDLLKNWIRKKNFEKLASLWVKGLFIDWSRLYHNLNPRRISLPTYPFESKRYWLPDISPKNVNSRRSKVTIQSRHPFLDGIDKHMCLDEEGIVFVKKFYPKDLIIKDHKVNYRSIFPGSGYLEMALAATKEIMDAESFILSRIVWKHPLHFLDTPKNIQIILKKRKEIIKYKIQTTNGKQCMIHSFGDIFPLKDTLNKNNRHINIDEFKSTCLGYIEPDAHYSHTANFGISYGPYFQTLKGIWKSKNETLGLLQLNSQYHDEINTFLLHPTIADGALQTIASIIKSSNGSQHRILLPYYIEKIEILNSLHANSYAHAKAIGKNRYDVAILNSDGRVNVFFHNIMLRYSKDPFDNFFYASHWHPASLSPSKPIKLEITTQQNFSDRKIVIFYTEEGKSLKDNLINFHSNDRITEILLTSTLNMDSINTIFKSNNIAFIYFLCIMHDSKFDDTNFDALQKSVLNNHLIFFRLIKALINSAYVKQGLDLKIVTNNVYEVFSGDSIVPYTAGIYGLCKSMALEFQLLNISCIDVSIDENTSKKELKITSDMIASNPGSHNFSNYAIRNCRGYLRKIHPLNLPSICHLPLRQRGVYLILGGAGGIGFELAQYLAKYVNARLILIGKSYLTDAVRDKISKIKSSGGEVIYLQADATDLDAMKDAVDASRQKFGCIHGVFHSAIVLDDNALKVMDEKSFCSALGPKIFGSLVLNEAIGKENLDFLVFFSSVLSFTGNYAQANYAAASTFQDAFGSYLNQHSHYPVMVINWGYWGSVGAVADKKYRKHFLSKGVHSIEPDEGIQALNRILSQRINQVIAFKAKTSLFDMLEYEKSSQIEFVPKETETVFNSTIDTLFPFYLNNNCLSENRKLFYEIEGFASKLLLAAFQKIGIFKTSNDRYDKHDLYNILKIQSNYSRLIDSFLTILEQAGYIKIYNQFISASNTIKNNFSYNDFAELVAKKDELSTIFPEIKPYLEYLWICTYHLPDILRGNVSSTEIIFSDSSFALLEKIYKNNVFADYFNSLIADTVYCFINDRLTQLKAKEQIRIVEVGAGTGGTSSAVFKRIKDFSDKIVYWYTDISSSFINFGKKEYGNLYPFFNTKKLDIENDVTAQGLPKGLFDIIIASNVLHATRHLRATIYNIKALLKARGVLLLSEATAPTNFTTMTFGLFEGWWLFEDPLDRLPNSPLLNSDMWFRILKETGFKYTKIIDKPHNEDNFFPQRVFLAESDGIIINNNKTNKRAIENLSIRENKILNSNILNETKIKSEDNTSDLLQHIEDKVIDCISSNLQIEKNEFDSITPFSEFGVDSISALKIINDINDILKIDMEPTDLFNYSTITNLCNYIIKKFNPIIKIDSSYNTLDQDRKLLSETNVSKTSISKKDIEFAYPSSTKDQALLNALKNLENDNADADADEIYRLYQEDIQ